MAKIGLLTTYNQDWAITRYVDRLVQSFGSSQVLILSESVSEARRLRPDASNVKRCWKRTSANYRELLETIRAEKISILHVNCVFPFFDTPQFSELISTLRQEGVGIVAHVLDSNALDTVNFFLKEQVDAVFLDNHRVAHAAVARGISREKQFVVPSAVSEPSSEQGDRAALGIPENARVAVCFDVGLPEAKIEDIVAAVYQLQSTQEELHLYVLQIDAGTGFDGGYAEQLQKKVESLHLDNYIHFIEDKAGDSILSQYVAVADVAIASASRPQQEMREALGVVLEHAVPLIAVGEMQLSDLEPLALQVGPRNPIERALADVLEQAELHSALSEASAIFAQANSAMNVAELFAQVYSAVGKESFEVLQSPEALETPKKEAKKEAPWENTPQAPAMVSSKLRVLMLNRSNALTHRGGDTVVMERVTQGLMALGHHVDVDVEGRRDPAEYDIAHLYNFAIREATEQMARRCVAAKTPYVVTTMYEDWPKFYNQMANHYFALKAYGELGQPKANWAELSAAAKAVDPAPAWDNSWTANHCAALIATGAYEAESLRRDYPQTPLVEVYRCGHEVSDWNGGGDLFRKETGIEDFVLCVGRLEWRKNQLMLLKALEDSDITVVFATGGFTYQPEYEEVCRKFKRKGKTVYLGRLDSNVLASAFCAARVHVLPSWYELPGLVSLEAAHYETNVVVTDYGTARDYLEEKAYYCAPDDDESILNAVTAAYYAPTKQGLREQVAQFTWERAAERNLEIYYKALGRDVQPSPAEEVQPPEPKAPKMETPKAVSFSGALREASEHSTEAKDTVVKIPEVVGSEPSPKNQAEQALRLCLKGDEHLIAGEHQEALSCYEEAGKIDPNSARVFRSQAVVRLTLEQHDEAEPFFRSALRQDPRDVKSLIGLGAVQWAREEKQEAFDLYLRAAEIEPTNVSCVLYLVNAAYELNKLDDLEKALRKFLQVDKENVNIQYCLAGCYFRQEKYARSEGILERILQVNPAHEEAMELREEIRKRRGQSAPASGGQLMEEPSGLRIPENAQIVKFEAPQEDEAPAAAAPLSARVAQLEEMKRRKDYKGVISKGRALLEESAFSDSQKALTKILIGECLANTGDYAQADSEFAAALSDRTYAFRAINGRAALAATLEQWEEAEQLFKESLERKADYDPAIAGLGIVAMSKGKTEEAWKFFSKALSHNCENMQAIHGLVQLSYSLNRFAESEAALKAYLDIHPVDLSMLYTYAGCLFAQGRKNEAEEQCRTILIFDQQHELALELLAKIETDDGRRASVGA